MSVSTPTPSLADASKMVIEDRASGAKYLLSVGERDTADEKDATWR